MAHIEDIERIQYILNNYDNITLLRNKKGKVLSVAEIFGKVLSFNEYTYEDLKQMGESFRAGAVIGVFAGGVHSVTYGQANKLLEGISNEKLGRAVINSEASDVMIDNAVKYGENSESAIVKDLAKQVKEDKGKGKLTEGKLGKLVRNISGESVDLVKGPDVKSKETAIGEVSKDISSVLSAISKGMGGAELSEAEMQEVLLMPDAFSLYTGVELSENKEEQIKVFFDKAKEKNKRGHSIISAISDRTGLAFDYNVTLPVNVAGVYNPETKKITLNPANEKALDYAVVHELTHFVENKKGYTGFKNNLMKSNYYLNEFLVKNNYSDVDAFRADMAETYKNAYAGLTPEQFNEAIDYEMTAKVAEDLINSDVKALERLAKGDKGFKAVIREIVEFFEEIYHKLNGESEKAYALRKARELRGLINIKEVTNSEEKDYITYSIEMNDKGYYVKADRQVVFGNTKKEMAKNIEDYINSILDSNGNLEIKTLDGEDIVINETTAWKIADVKKSVNDMKIEMSDEEFAVKAHAGAHIDELLKISKNTNTYKIDKKDHYFADYWGYRTVFFEDYDGKTYRLWLSIGIIPEEGYKAYNIGNIKSGTNKVIGSSAHSPGRLTENVNSTIDNIPQKNSIVNINSMPKTEKNSQSDEKVDFESLREAKSKTVQKIFSTFSIPLNRRTELKAQLEVILKTVEKGQEISDSSREYLYNILKEKSMIKDTESIKDLIALRNEIRTTKIKLSEDVRRNFSPEYIKSLFGHLSLSSTEGRGLDEYHAELLSAKNTAIYQQLIKMKNGNKY